MKFLNVRLIRDWGSYYKKDSIVSVSEDVAKMMTSEVNRYGYLVEGLSSDEILNQAFDIADDEEE